jgi:hypothetical protein
MALASALAFARASRFPVQQQHYTNPLLGRFVARPGFLSLLPTHLRAANCISCNIMDTCTKDSESYCFSSTLWFWLGWFSAPSII